MSSLRTSTVTSSSLRLLLLPLLFWVLLRSVSAFSRPSSRIGPDASRIESPLRTSLLATQQWPFFRLGSLQNSASNNHDDDHTTDENTNDDEDNNNNDDDLLYTMDISYEGRTCTTTIKPGESILSALERTTTGAPSDCRRGNCLTCVGKHAPGSQTDQLQPGDDGLSPYMSQEAQKRGYILTCSSTVRGNGVKLQIASHQDAWTELYQQRLEEEPIKLAGRAAMAQVIRMNAEQNVEEWTQETEKVLRKTD